MKKISLVIFWLLSAFINKSFAQYPKMQGDLKELFEGPVGPSEYVHWLAGMKAWREDIKDKLKYDDSRYHEPALAWIKKSFIYVQMMAVDRYFYDPIQRKYTVDLYLDDLKKRYGGLDAVLIWPTYPNMGIDNRNQFDWVSNMPGGIQGVRQMVIDFKKRGVRVFFPIMVWDKGTRDIGAPISVALVKEMQLIGADGMNGDTMLGVTEDFRDASDSLHYPLVLQPEMNISDLKMLEWNEMSWGYFWNYEYVPGVSVYKWMEPGHQVQVTNRWIIDKTDDLQYAFFNGIGYNAWENIWGIWNQIPQRYAEAIRRIATIYRQFPDVWKSADWQPHIPTLQKGIFASVFPGAGQIVYSLVNRDSTNIRGRQLQLPYKKGVRYFDVWNGTELHPHREGNHIYLSFSIEGRGFGAVAAIGSNAPDSSFNRFLRKMHMISLKPLKSFPVVWNPLPQHIGSLKTTRSYTKIPEGMVLIPEAKNYPFESNGVMIEGNELPTAVGVQHPWEKHPSRSQKHSMNISSFYIDKYPVTNKQFMEFINASDYRPKDDHNFLKDWSNGVYPKGWDDRPVTWVSLEDARAYASWAGKRLPHEWEWQYAGQGTDARLYPWGNEMDSTRMPLTDSGHNSMPPSPVNAFPQGSSPFGVMDMVGNVWQWTDEYADKHTRSAILKGGSYYHLQSSFWYFPQAYELNKYGKYLLMSPGMDRAGTIGFRCAADR
jgi:formylglycine-generating enzyme required for sulfatase activity